LRFNQKVLRPNIFEIDLDAISYNIEAIQKFISKEIKIFAVLKCNAYGFGLIEVAKIVEKSKAFAIALADIYDAILLRENGIKKPILVYANSLPSAAPYMIKYNLIPSIDNIEYARAYSQASSDILNIFIKVDTGRYRNGVFVENLKEFCNEILKFKNLRILGVYSHLDRLDLELDTSYVNWQFLRFKKEIQKLKDTGINIPINIASSSAEVLQFPYMFMNAIDIGKIIYGIYYPQSKKNVIDLKNPFKSLKTKIILKKEIPNGNPFKNKLNFRIRKDMIIGIIPIGWGDGLPTLPLNTGEVLVKGKRVKILGNNYVEHSRINLTDVPEAKVGDEVVIIGEQGNEKITITEIAKLCNIGESRLTRTVRSHIPRLFYKNGKPYKFVTPLGEKYI